MSEQAFAIITHKNDLWYAQEQGVCGRQTIGGYVTLAACIRACADAFGENVVIEIDAE